MSIQQSLRDHADNMSNGSPIRGHILVAAATIDQQAERIAELTKLINGRAEAGAFIPLDHMTLRDRIAIEALPTCMIFADTAAKIAKNSGQGNIDVLAVSSQLAYKQSDAMLKERAK